MVEMMYSCALLKTKPLRDAGLRPKRLSVCDSGKDLEARGNGSSASFLDFSAPDASRADFFPDGVAVLDHADGLDVRREGAGRVFHDVHTDTAFFLGQTAADDVSALDFVLSANFANVAHDGFLRAILSIDCLFFDKS